MLLTINTWFFLAIASTLIAFLTQKDRSQYLYGFTYGLLFLIPTSFWLIIVYLIMLPFAERIYRLKEYGWILLGLAFIGIKSLVVFTVLYILFCAALYIMNKAYKTEIKIYNMAALSALIVVYQIV